ncbi:MAG: CHASE2 domain-containing protein [Candidatus Omnitrophota bacterium]|jgi:serine phosphatase RsbU (regulator of sigma subunit)
MSKARLLLFALGAACLVPLLSRLPLVDTMDRHGLDVSFMLRGHESPHPRIVIVEIDDPSLAAIGSWPWPRSYHAALLKAIRQNKPDVVFYDIVFPEASSEDEDQIFSEEIKKAGNVVLPYYFVSSSPKNFWENQAVMPIRPFEEAARALAYTNHFRDRDGRTRELTLTVPGEKTPRMQTSLAVAGQSRGFDRRLPDSLKPGQPTLINFPSPYEAFRRISFIDLMDIENPTTAQLFKSFEGSIVLVGLTATGTTDLIPTVYSPVYPGVGMQACMIHTLLTGKKIVRMPALIHALLAFLFILLGLRLSSGRHPLKGLFEMTSCWILLAAGVQIAFQEYGLWVPGFGIFTVSAAVFITGLLLQFLKTRLDRELMLKELSLAANIQKSFLPSPLGPQPGLRVAGVNFPARQIGGDLYDLHLFEDGRLSACVGDVSGKGAPAALFMAKSISELRREAPGKNPAAVLAALNANIVREGSAGLFLTLLYLIADPKSGTIIFSSGGHEPVYHYRAHARAVELRTTKEGLPLGILEDAVYVDAQAKAASGDVLLLISDGVKEAMNARREMFGAQRTCGALIEAAHEEPQAVIDHILLRIREFVKDAPQHDDLTMVCLKFL